MALISVSSRIHYAMVAHIKTFNERIGRLFLLEYLAMAYKRVFKMAIDSWKKNIKTARIR